MKTETIANDAIGLFLEYRDKHGYDEETARTKAVLEVLEGVDADAGGTIRRIQAALGTTEEGDALVEVASNAHRAELELAQRIRELESASA